MNRTGQYPDVVKQISVTECEKLSAKYVAQFQSEVGAKSWRTNKEMGLFLHLGLVSILFPAAKIIHCRRNPLDTCVSAYFQFFKLYHLQYSFDLATLGRYYRAYKSLMAHWNDHLPMDILQFDYEDLTKDPEGAIRRISAFCGMEWSSDCLSFEQSDSMVKTASIWQVRQGMHQKSVDRWMRYEKHLAPLTEGLGDLATE